VQQFIQNTERQMATQEEVSSIFTGMCERLKPEKAEGMDATIQFDLTGDNGGLYWIKIADGACTTGEGQAENPKMTLKASANDYFDVATGKLNAMQAFMSGKLKIQGDMGLAMKMQSMFSM
jgi:putative sterol carrier protein